MAKLRGPLKQPGLEEERFLVDLKNDAAWDVLPGKLLEFKYSRGERKGASRVVRVEHSLGKDRLEAWDYERQAKRQYIRGKMYKAFILYRRVRKSGSQTFSEGCLDGVRSVLGRSSGTQTLISPPESPEQPLQPESGAEEELKSEEQPSWAGSSWKPWRRLRPGHYLPC